jgi:5-methyltetrahydrofolate--homocysteine methyltransferase
MNLDRFDWEKTTDNWEKWWNGTLGRPVFICRSQQPDVNQSTGKLPCYPFTSHYDFGIPAKDILMEVENRVSNVKYYADAFPAFWPNFGPGVLASFIGGAGVNHENTVWFYPGAFENCKIEDIAIKLDKNAPWFRRIEEFFVAASEIWQGKIQFGMTDIGGTLDVLSSLRPGEKLLLDLYDSPDEVKRLIREIHEVWHEVFEYFNNIIKNKNRGYTSWTPLLSQETYYMLQCDFCYMISPEMFEEFVKPELAASCRKMSRPFYHLDGTGELPHLDHLCSIPELRGIQWIPGAGAPPAVEWPDVLKKIVDSGKKLQIFFTEPEEIDRIVECIGNPEAVAFIGSVNPENEEKLINILEKYGAMDC